MAVAAPPSSPDSCPDEKREPARPPPPEVDIVQPADFSELYGDSESPEDFLASLEENVDAATEFGSTYKIEQLGEGDHVTAVSIDSQNFLNDQGQWQKIDTTLLFQSQGPQQEPGGRNAAVKPGAARSDARSRSDPGLQDCTQAGWTNQAGPVEVFFPEQVSCLPIRFTMDEGSLLVTALEINGQVSGTMQDNTVTYTSTVPGVQFKYWATPGGYKESIILASSPPGTGLTWDIWAPDVTLQLESGAVSILAGTEVVADIPPTLATDAVGLGITFPYQLQEIEVGHYQLSVIYDSVRPPFNRSISSVSACPHESLNGGDRCLARSTQWSRSWPSCERPRGSRGRA